MPTIDKSILDAQIAAYQSQQAAFNTLFTDIKSALYQGVRLEYTSVSHIIVPIVRASLDSAHPRLPEALPAGTEVEYPEEKMEALVRINVRLSRLQNACRKFMSRAQSEFGTINKGTTDLLDRIEANNLNVAFGTQTRFAAQVYNDLMRDIGRVMAVLPRDFDQNERILNEIKSEFAKIQDRMKESALLSGQAPSVAGRGTMFGTPATGSAADAAAAAPAEENDAGTTGPAA